MKRLEGHVVDRNPDRTTPVVLALPEEFVALCKTSDAVARPQVFGVLDVFEDGVEVRRVGRKETKEEGEDGDVAFVADVVGLVCAA